MNDLQNKLFETVRQRAQNPRHWIDEVAGVLHKSKYAIYKKIQGETCLSLDEVVTLAAHYGLQLDPMIRPGATLSFEFPADSDSYRYPRYLTDIRNELELAISLPDAHIWHAGIDLPLLHDHLCPDIVMFKFFIRQCMVSPESHKGRYDLAEFSKDAYLKRLLKDLLVKYYRIATTEIWNSMILDITLGQIRYALQSGMLVHPQDALTLCTELETLVVHLENMAECGMKHLPGENAGAEFHVFHNEIAHAINVWLLKSERIKALYLGFSNPQFLYAQDGAAVENTERWLLKLRNNATPITCESRKERVAFFFALQKKIVKARAEIEAIIKMNEL